MNELKNWQDQLLKNSNPGKIKILSSFFKSGKGEYGEGDKFIGLNVPINRKISKQFYNLPFSEIEKMLCSPIHEFRLAALLALVERYRKNKKTASAIKQIVDFYLSHTANINNWDLVDLSAPQIIGQYMLDTDCYEISERLVFSDNLWEQRISIVATYTLIKAGKHDLTLRLAKILLSHKHDLIHKATGWMLREVGKRDINALTTFLDTFAPKMPRTALRYAIEKLDSETRKHYMSLK